MQEEEVKVKVVEGAAVVKMEGQLQVAAAAAAVFISKEREVPADLRATVGLAKRAGAQLHMRYWLNGFEGEIICL
jgi:hypothetical protein